MRTVSFGSQRSSAKQADSFQASWPFVLFVFPQSEARDTRVQFVSHQDPFMQTVCFAADRQSSRGVSDCAACCSDGCLIACRRVISHCGLSTAQCGPLPALSL